MPHGNQRAANYRKVRKRAFLNLLMREVAVMKLVMSALPLLSILLLSGCGGLFWMIEQGKYAGQYGLNEDGGCDEECIKKYFKGSEGDEDMAYCDCRNKR